MELEMDAISLPIPPVDCAVHEDSCKDEQMKDTIDENKLNNEDKKREKITKLEPPKDDCCPICFGDFSIPCRTNCGHWFCAACIIEYWKYSSLPNASKCPMCFIAISKLTPHEPPEFPEEEDSNTLKNIQQYNDFYAGGIKCLFLKILESSSLMKRQFLLMVDSDRPEIYDKEIRILALLVTYLYRLASSSFPPTGGMVDVAKLFKFVGIGLLVIIRSMRLYRAWRRLGRAILQSDAAEPPLMLEYY